ncbi:MAG: DJ-1/PfpI family protein, partial [Lachnospiraceae bacterium]|nr:DJ-1/PfpI family protein [Lachnospiraceae bacterium]
YLFLAEGFEEIEALAVVDLLRRAKLSCFTVSIKDSIEVKGSHNITVKADKLLSDIKVEKEDVFILPGGMPGTSNLASSKSLCDILTKANENDQMICAICAAPTILGGLGILDGRKATCYPGCEDRLGKATYLVETVVRDKNIISSRGMGTAIDFGLEIIKNILGQEEADSIAKSIIYR